MASTSKNSGFVDDWQKGKSVIECHLHMLENEVFTDVNFRLGPEKHVVRAHRSFLVSRSCVFEAMFCGPLAEKGEITITDIEPEIFKDFLRYAYTDNVTINNDNVTGLLYTSRKYNIGGLFEDCIRYLERSLSEDTACQIIEECHPYPDPDLMKKAFDFLTNAGKRLIKTPGFLRLCHECLGKFLKSPNLKLKEEEVFEATMSWVREKCEVENVPVNQQNIHRFLGDLRYEIRFSAMSLDYLVKVVGPNGILTENERIKFMDRKFDPNINISPFMPLFRNEYARKSVQRFLSGRGSKMVPNCTHVISFSASKTIVLKGIYLYGPYSVKESKYTLSVDLIEKEGNHKCCSFERKEVILAKTVQNAIKFPSDVLLKANTVYTLRVFIGGDVDTWCSSSGQRSVTVDGVVFRFSNSLTAGFLSPTDVLHGQVPGLIVGIKDHECTTCRKCMHEKNK